MSLLTEVEKFFYYEDDLTNKVVLLKILIIDICIYYDTNEFKIIISVYF